MSMGFRTLHSRHQRPIPVGCDDYGSVMWREEGDAHDLQLGSRTVHLDASGLRAIADAEVEEDSNQLVYACVRGEARVEPQGGEA